MSGTSAEVGARHEGWTRSLESFVGSWRFAVLILSFLGAWTAAQVLLLVLPAPAGPADDLLNQLRVLCLGMDPATGDYQTVWLAMLIGDPLALAAVLAAVWWRQLAEARRTLGMRGLARWAWPGPAALGAAGLFFAAAAGPGPVSGPGGALPFPASDLRTELPAPDLSGLVDQRGQPLRMEELRGRPVLLTAVYGCCTRTCPIILSEAILAHREQAEAGRSDWVLLAVTMDPERDDPAALAVLAEGYGIADDPSWRLLSGPPERVDAALDAMGVSRSRDPVTGEIDHSNQFLLLDRAGRLAYRLGLASEVAPDWLARAMEALQREAPAP